MTNTAYLRHLGIDITWLVAIEQQKHLSNCASHTHNYQCVVVSNQPISTQAAALLAKMMSAIGVGPEHYSIVTELTEVSYKVAFFLDKATYQIHTALEHFYLTHPEHMLTHPELKKEAWETLKRAKVLIS